MKRFVPRRMLVALFTLAIATPSFADEAAVHALPSPAWAVEFGIANASLTSFDGATISLRQQRSPHAAWRYGLSVSATTSKNDQNGSSYGTNPATTDETKSTTSNVAASLTRLTFPAPDAVVRPWFGAGLELGWNTSNIERNTVYYEADGTVSETSGYKDRNNGPSVAVLGLFGLECSASDRFAIHAQYGQSIRYRRLQYERDDYTRFPGSSNTDHFEGPLNEWSTAGVSARAGVSVFW